MIDILISFAHTPFGFLVVTSLLWVPGIAWLADRRARSVQVAALSPGRARRWRLMARVWGRR